MTLKKRTVEYKQIAVQISHLTKDKLTAIAQEKGCTLNDLCITAIDDLLNNKGKYISLTTVEIERTNEKELPETTISVRVNLHTLKNVEKLATFWSVSKGAILKFFTLRFYNDQLSE